jgi:streptomycin 6-kinase
VIVVPARFAADTVAREGEAGRAWLAALPGLVEAYLRRWALTPDGRPMHGYVALVLPVRRADGTPAVLKVSWLDPESIPEPAALAAWAGHGAVRLLDRADHDGAMLIERLDPARTLEDLPDGAAATALLGTVLARLDVPAPPGIPRLADAAARWARELPRDAERMGRPLPRLVVDTAVATCRDLGPDGDTLLHGDLHYANVLAGEREPWLAIDPKGLAGDRGYEAAPALWNRWEEIAAADDPRRALLRRLAVLTEAAGIDRERARRWAQMRNVDNALWFREHGGYPDAEVADQLARWLV